MNGSTAVDTGAPNAAASPELDSAPVPGTCLSLLLSCAAGSVLLSAAPPTPSLPAPDPESPADAKPLSDHWSKPCRDGPPRFLL